jgi:hypothetical protein
MADREIVLTMIQLVSGNVMFADHESKPDNALSMPREAWDGLGNPTTVTVTATPGGEFIAQPEEPVTQPGLQSLFESGPYSGDGTGPGSGAYL